MPAPGFEHIDPDARVEALIVPADEPMARHAVGDMFDLIDDSNEVHAKAVVVRLKATTMLQKIGGDIYRQGPAVEILWQLVTSSNKPHST